MTQPDDSQPSISASDWGLLFLLGALWGGSFFFARIAVAEIPPLNLVLFRVGIAAIALHFYLLARGISFATILPMAASFLGLSLLNNVIPFSLMFAGQTEIGAGLASVLNATTPFWTMLLASRLAGEALTARKAAGILLGIAGTAVMVGPGLIAGLGGPAWAKFALIGTACSYACASIFAKRFTGLAPELVAAGQLTMSTLVMLPVVLATSGAAGLFSASTTTWSAVLALALASTAFAYVIYFRLIRSAGATNTSLVTLLVPLSAILLGILLLGEQMDRYEAGGIALIGLGLLVVDGRITRLFRQAPANERSAAHRPE